MTGAAIAVPVPPTIGSAARAARLASMERRVSWLLDLVSPPPLNGHVPLVPPSIPRIRGPLPRLPQ